MEIRQTASNDVETSLENKAVKNLGQLLDARQPNAIELQEKMKMMAALKELHLSSPKSRRVSSLEPLWSAALIVGIAGACVFLVIASTQLIHDFALPHSLILFSYFVFGYAAVLVLQSIANYFQHEDE